MGSDFEDSDPDADNFKKVQEEDSWDRSSSDEYDDEYGSEAGSQLDEFDGDKVTGTKSPNNEKEGTKKENTTYGKPFLNDS